MTSERKQFTEKNIQVKDCSLTQDKRLTLCTKCRDYFDQDSWAAVGDNTMDNSNTAMDLIFPLYAEVGNEDFWLFYCPGQSLHTVNKARGSAKLKRYLLDRKTTSHKYSILEDVSEIKIKWNIKTDHGPLYYEQHWNVCKNEEGNPRIKFVGIHLGGERPCESKVFCPRTMPPPGVKPVLLDPKTIALTILPHVHSSWTFIYLLIIHI